MKERIQVWGHTGGLLVYRPDGPCVDELAFVTSDGTSVMIPRKAIDDALTWAGTVERAEWDRITHQDQDGEDTET